MLLLLLGPDTCGDPRNTADETILTLAADIVRAHVSHNSVATCDLPMLIQSVFGALAALGQDAPVVEEPRPPAVSVRSSVRPDALVCLDCRAKMKMLKRHLANDHGLSPAEYRTRWQLAADCSMVAADYAARRKELALSIGLGCKPKVGPTPVVPGKAAPQAKVTAQPLAHAPVVEAAPIATTPVKTPARRKAIAKAPEATPAEKPAAKPRAPRKKLKVAFDTLDVSTIDALPANAATED